ncbi:MAG: hypothetical protein AUF79_11260 [Crenarchaeota archaeon 13_1_20CM_2_51_8]|nr:MAG: hypothetical protein AUF79_11260 [Crenarchaeota archaeon 13_1_20CM_2_51_8]
MKYEVEFTYISLLRRHDLDISDRSNLSADSYGARMAELDLEIGKVQHEMNERQAKGSPTVDLEKRLEELEGQKHGLVERLEALWSA